MSNEPLRIEMPMHPSIGPVNAYLFTDPDIVLVDTGPGSPAAWDALTAGLASHGVGPAEIRRVIITHPHHDHFAQAGRIAELGAAQVWIAEIGAPSLLDGATYHALRVAYYTEEFLPGIGLGAAEIERAVEGMHAIYASITPVSVERIVTFASGATLTLGGEPWTVLHTPGHADAQTVFYQPQTKRLLASDMLLPVTPTPVVDAPPVGGVRQPNLPQFLDSLTQMEALDVAKVYPGHGAPFVDHRALIRSQRQRIVRRKEECLEQIVAGRHTIAALFPAMYGNRDPARAGLAGLWMLVGYVDLLLAEGRITREVVDNVWYFRSAG